ncbi:MAG: hypothetical protein K2X49_06325 [Acetobacteraceae bacterium]|nr:hypothetical protein [Acetobacteraceae bacterium]
MAAAAELRAGGLVGGLEGGRVAAAAAARSVASWPSSAVLACSNRGNSCQIAGSALVSPVPEPGGNLLGSTVYQAIMSSIRASAGRGSPRASEIGFIASMCSPMRFSPARRSAMTVDCA